jgi:hypothetical protein
MFVRKKKFKSFLLTLTYDEYNNSNFIFFIDFWQYKKINKQDNEDIFLLEGGSGSNQQG